MTHLMRKAAPPPAVRSAAIAAMMLAGLADGASAADFTAREMTTELYRASEASPLDFSKRDLAGLDLAGLAFKKARLAEANLFGADLSGADLTGVDLRNAQLDRVVAIGARFDQADLSGASLLRPTTTANLEPTKGEAPSFAGANLTRTKLFGIFIGSNFAGARLQGASFAPANRTGFIENMWRSRLDAADFSGADLSGADLTYVSFRFANLKGANLTGAQLRNADLSHADLTGANLTGAALADVDLDRANLTGVVGLDSATGFATARNRDKTIN